MEPRGPRSSVQTSAIWLMFGIVVCAGSLAASPAQAEDRFTGIVQSTGGVAGAGLSQFRLNIEQYSTPAEAAELLTILRDQGWQQLEYTLVGTERARLILPGRLGHNIGYARPRHETARLYGGIPHHCPRTLGQYRRDGGAKV